MVGQAFDPDDSSYVAFPLVCLLHARSEGRLTLTASDAEATLDIRHAHLTDPADLDALTGPGPVKQRLERSDNRSRIARDTEVGPVLVVVGPRRSPPLVEVQPKVRRHIAGIGIDAAEGHRAGPLFDMIRR